ncbi:MAG: hypothetical protein K8I27_15450 [Planctomycetes bacterium]|nr:hypothetical protein [Planctomycetota bacterium]
MAAKESVSITYYVGVVNIILAAIWGALYGFGILSKSSINTPTATPFYVGTLFAVGFGLVFPFFEKTMSGKTKVNQGLLMSIIALIAYAGYIAIHFLKGSLVFWDVGFQIA